MEEIVSILNEVKPGVDYSKEKNLITDEILTSFDIVMLISLLNEKYNIDIAVTDLTPENFESVESIKELVDKLK